MNDELQSKLAEVLGGIADGVSQAKDFAVEQLPDVAQQYIMFGMVWQTVAFLVSLAVFVAFCMLLFFIIKKRSDLDEVIVGLGGGLTVVIAIPFSLVVVMETMKNMLMVWFAPKLYLLQGIAGLLK